MTIEDPIEFLHTHKRCIVNQREVGSDTKSFAEALRHVLRQDPDVILVGEMRDLETIATALTAAETGHLVFATLHTQDAPQTIDRIIDVFPSAQQDQIRVQLAGSLRSRHHPAAGAERRAAPDAAPVAEVMLCNPAIRNLIREGEDPPDLLGDPDGSGPGNADDGPRSGQSRPERYDHRGDGFRPLPRSERAS